MRASTQPTRLHQWDEREELPPWILCAPSPVNHRVNLKVHYKTMPPPPPPPQLKVLGMLLSVKAERGHVMEMQNFEGLTL